jgi:hypothetical protein
LFQNEFEVMPSGVCLVLFSNREEVTQSSFRKERNRIEVVVMTNVSMKLAGLSDRCSTKPRFRMLPEPMAGIDDESNQVS